MCVCVLVYYLSALFALASGSEVHHLLKGTANVHFLQHHEPLLAVSSLCFVSCISLVLPQILQHREGSVPLLAIKAQTNISKTLNSSLIILLLTHTVNTTAATNTAMLLLLSLL